jgi:hypothetical protein
MAAFHLIGFDKDLLAKVPKDISKRQIFVYNVLSIMIWVVILICVFSSIVYAQLIFDNLIISISVALFMGFIIHNLYKLFVITTLNGSKIELGKVQKNKESFNETFSKIDLENTSDEAIALEIYKLKEILRVIPEYQKIDNERNGNRLLTLFIKIIIIAIISFVFSTGLELFIFRSKINEVVIEIKSRINENESLYHWKPFFKENTESRIFKTSSLLLNINILNLGLGNSKYLFDILILIVFLMPLYLSTTSKEIYAGAYIKELVLKEIYINNYHYLTTEKYCRSINRVNDNLIIKTT